MLEARGASYAINGRRLADRVDAAIAVGSLVVLAGPNGAGKSTLLRLLAGELRASGGEILFGGQPINQLRPAIMASRRAVVPQHTGISFPFTVLDVVALGASVPGFERLSNDGRRHAVEAIGRTGLAGLEGRPVTELSGGERQRVHLARALCQLAAAPIASGVSQALLLDEPTASLDVAHQLLVMEEARRQARGGRAVLIVLHDLNLAAAFADKIILMEAGRVVLSGPPGAVLNASTLSKVYGCRMSVTQHMPDGRLTVLPMDLRSPEQQPDSTIRRQQTAGGMLR